jgi:hypothetical protein
MTDAILNWERGICLEVMQHSTPQVQAAIAIEEMAERSGQALFP